MTRSSDTPPTRSFAVPNCDRSDATPPSASASADANPTAPLTTHTSGSVAAALRTGAVGARRRGRSSFRRRPEPRGAGPGGVFVASSPHEAHVQVGPRPTYRRRGRRRGRQRVAHRPADQVERHAQAPTRRGRPTAEARRETPQGVLRGQKRCWSCAPSSFRRSKACPVPRHGAGTQRCGAGGDLRRRTAASPPFRCRPRPLDTGLRRYDGCPTHRRRGR